MKENTSCNLTFQIQMHLECLKLSGVEWLQKTRDILPKIETPVVNHLSTIFPEKTSANPSHPIKPVSDEITIPPALVETGNLELVNHSQSTIKSLTISERATILEVLKLEVASCKKCSQLAKSRKQTIFGKGKLDPEVCFVGEAPSFLEEEKGEPFQGDAGVMLDKIINLCGWQRDDVYMLNIISCSPPDERLPTTNEIYNCKCFLEKQLALVNPNIIFCLGGFAAQSLLGSKVPVSKMRGNFYQWKGIPTLCTYHPMSIIRNPEKKKDMWEDFKILMAHLGRPIALRS